MRRIWLLAALLAVIVTPTVASAKLPFFGLEAAPLHPRVGEPITITMTCYEDADHSRASSSCFGDSGVMAWVHPLDEGGDLDRDDWIPVLGHGTPSGASRGRIVLDEPGSYDVLPLWRRWAYDHGRGFPDPIRIEVGRRAPIAALAAAGVGAACAGLAVALWRRRSVSTVIQVQSNGPASTS